MQGLSIRWKLTLWYGLVLALVLAAFSTAVYFTMRHQLSARMDQGLTEESADVLFEVHRARDDAGLAEWLERRFAGHAGFDFQITRPDGSRFFFNQRLQDTVLPLPAAPTALEAPSFRDLSVGDRHWRVLSVAANGPGECLTIQIGRSLESYHQESRALLATFLLLGPVTLLIAVGGGYVLARRALAPVDHITRTAKQISADRLSQRIEVPNRGDELGALAATLNEMIERLERSFADMQRFTADAAHELRTPLAVIRSEAEIALRTSRTPEEYSRALEGVLEETTRLANIADQLLFLCRQDAGLTAPLREDVDVDALLRQVVANMQPVAVDKHVDMELTAATPCGLVSDSGLLRRVLYNLIDNAVKYTPSSGQVTVQSAVENECLTITVADTGIGVAPEHLPHIFDRFYRADPARERDGSGAGLGLSICRSIVQRLGGNIHMDSQVGTGTRVQVRLPLHESACPK